MNPEVKKMWVEALRSGEYQQKTGALRKGDGFCCLGVLCDLHAKESGNAWETRSAFIGSHAYLRRDAHLPKDVQEWAGLDTCWGGNVTIAEKAMDLDDHNDNGIPFAEIANAIEGQL